MSGEITIKKEDSGSLSEKLKTPTGNYTMFNYW